MDSPLTESPLPAECCEGVCDGIPHDDDCETPLWEEIDRLKRERDELRAKIVADIRAMMRDQGIEGTTGYLFTGDTWNNETAEDIIDVIERGGLHV